MYHHGHGTISGVAGSPWPIWVALAALALAVIVVVIWLMTRPARVDEAEDPQAAVPENLDGQILAMLHQAGRAMAQTEIRANLDLPLDRVASILRDLEEKGRIHRHWQTDRYTFTVRART